MSDVRDRIATAPGGPLRIEPRAPRPGALCYGSMYAKSCSREATGPDGLCTFHAARFARHEISCFEQYLAGRGYALRYVELCEDATTPGLPGYYAGVTSHQGKWVKVSIRTPHDTPRRRSWLRDRTVFEIAEILRHECRHVADPEWDCGNRSIL